MDIGSKFSLFDILAMIIPGGVIMACILYFFNISIFPDNEIYCCCCLSDKFDWNLVNSTIFIVASYIIGIINNGICDWCFRGFRNCPFAISNALILTLRRHDNKGLRNYKGSVYDRNKMRVYCLACLSNKTIISMVTSLSSCHKTGELTGVVKQYYSAYYDLSKDNLLGAIPALERQVVLLRNLIIPLPIAIFCLPCSCSTKLILAAIFLVLLFLTMVQRQQKVYEIVWESVNYYQR